MTNYNERLDELLTRFADGEYSKHWVDERKTYTKLEAKQAIISLIKELVEEAKPINSVTQWGSVTIYGDLSGRELNTINQFEHNLLKELEEV